MSTGVTNRKGEGSGKETDGGREGVEEIRETDHLRSAGHQHKPVGEGRSPLGSVLQRDGRRKEVAESKIKAKETTEGWGMVKADTKKDTQRVLKNKTSWLRCREPSGCRIRAGEIWFVSSQFFKMPVCPRCLHQILTTCQTKHFVVH